MAVVLIDLDETLIHDVASTRAAYGATLADAAAQGGWDAAVAAAAVEAAAERLWGASATAPYCQRIGISAGEGMWATFALGDDPDTLALRAFAPSYRRQAWRAGLETLGVADPDLVADLAERFVWERGRRQIPFDEAVGVLCALRAAGHHLVLLTNGDRDLQRRKVAASGLLPLFDGVVISGLLGIGKPDPAIFVHALGLVGGRPEAAVMVGDSPHRDIAGANAAGIRGVWVDRGLGAPPPPNAWRTVPNLNPLPELIS